MRLYKWKGRKKNYSLPFISPILFSSLFIVFIIDGCSICDIEAVGENDVDGMLRNINRRVIVKFGGEIGSGIGGNCVN